MGETRAVSTVTGAGSVTDLAWLQYSNATRDTSIGSVSYTDNEIDVRLQDVERPRNYIRTSNNDSPIEKTVFDLSQTREGGAPTGSMAYAIVPGANDGKLLAGYLSREIGRASCRERPGDCLM